MSMDLMRNNLIFIYLCADSLMVGHWPSMESQKNNSMKANNPGRNSEIQIPVGASIQ